MATTTTTAREAPLVDMKPGETGAVANNMAMETFNAYYTSMWTEATVHKGDDSSPVLYYMSSKMMSNKPKFYLRKGTNAKAPMIAFLQSDMFSRHMLIGLGDYHDDSNHDWERLKRDKSLFRASDYSFSMTKGTPDGVRKQYVWRKDPSKSAATKYECVTEEGQVVATLRSGGLLNLHKSMEVDIPVDIPDDFRYMLFISAFGVYLMEYVNYRSIVPGWSSKDHHKE